ncbi:ATP-binding protein [Streptomyces lydicus]|uniref:ATP-binding protein n=1 Tax=Streptomyces lydicus TaxID=47763 RepID=UPI002E37CB85|nr:ATP-binding protein [Streptomyces lydicus]
MTMHDEVSYMSTTADSRTLTAPPALYVDLRSCPEGAGRARHLAAEFLRGLEPPLYPEDIEAVVLVVSELVTNAVRHAEGPSCALHLSACPEAIAVAVSDGSHVPPQPRTPDVSGEGGGFGWSMIHQIAEAVAVTDETAGKTVSALIPRHREDGSAHH